MHVPIPKKGVPGLVPILFANNAYKLHRTHK